MTLATYLGLWLVTPPIGVDRIESHCLIGLITEAYHCEVICGTHSHTPLTMNAA